MKQLSAAAAKHPCVNRWCLGMTDEQGKPCPIHKEHNRFHPQWKGRLSRDERAALMRVAFSK